RSMLSIWRRLIPPCFPYTTLFRSWPQVHAEGGALLDRMCGSGTLLVEGAAMAADVAPGLLRHGEVQPSRWSGFDAGAWTALREEDRKSTRLNSSHVKISYAVICLK